MMCVGKVKMANYDVENGKYHVTSYVTQRNWTNICDLWFETYSDLVTWANSQVWLFVPSIRVNDR